MWIGGRRRPWPILETTNSWLLATSCATSLWHGTCVFSTQIYEADWQLLNGTLYNNDCLGKYAQISKSAALKQTQMLSKLLVAKIPFPCRKSLEEESACFLDNPHCTCVWGREHENRRRVWRNVKTASPWLCLVDTNANAVWINSSSTVQTFAHSVASFENSAIGRFQPQSWGKFCFTSSHN